ncbi:hypothetical protein D3C73_821320 [compost metagenome]
MCLPGFQLVKQAIKVAAQLMQFGNRRRRHPQAKGAIATYRMRDIGDVIQRTDNAHQHAAGKHQRTQGTEHQTGDHADHAAQQKAQQAAAVAQQPNFADLFAFMSNRQDHRFRQRPAGHDLFHTVQRAIFGVTPGGEHFAAVVQNSGFRYLLFGGDQYQRLTCGGAVFKHHGSFDGIADGACNQVQVMVGISAQRKQRDQRQENPGGADGNQRQPKMHPLQHPAQRRA